MAMKTSSRLIHRAPPDSAVHQLYCGLAAEILDGTPARETGEKTVLVTSPGRGDGRTLTAVNTAIAAAALGRGVLLLDADLRGGTIPALLELPDGAGLAEAVLEDRDPLELVQPHTGSGLSVLGAGAMSGRSPFSVVSGPRFNRVLDILCDAFDVVILDSAPLDAGSYVPYLVRACGRVLGVARAGWTGRREMTAFRETVLGMEGDLCGLVLTDLPEVLPRFVKRML